MNLPFHSDNSTPTEANQSGKRSLLPLGLGILGVLFLGAFGVALVRVGALPMDSQISPSVTGIAQQDALCQNLIENAMQASEDHCEKIGPNQVCYGNVTLQADLLPTVSARFAKRGDVIPVEDLLRLSASPLDLDTNEWGVAILRVMANLPGSLPGQTVTMVVFGNTVLDRRSDNLEAFYFSSQLGKIVCAKAPPDGLLITMPDGAGVQFNINDTDLTLQGDASLTATKNGEMQVALFSGNATIISAGKQQSFRAGEKVTVKLGGEGGTQAIGSPSFPEPLTSDDLAPGSFFQNNNRHEQDGDPPVIDIPDEIEDLKEDIENPKDKDKDKDDKDKDKKDKDKDKKDKDKDKKDKDKDKDK